MKAPRCSATRATRFLTLLASSMLLVQCSLPTPEAWRYIQSNGLINYWSYSSQQHSSPPFRSGSNRYAAIRRYAPTRNNTPPANNWFSWWGSGQPNGPTNRYYVPTPTRPNSGSVAKRSTPRPQLSPTPKVERSVNEPSQKPQVTSTPPPTPNNSGSVTLPPAPKPVGDLPFGSLVAGRPNMVNSPYAGKTQLVDVSGMGAGQTVKCPYTGKLFKVPSAQQASNTAPKAEPKLEEPKGEEKPKN